MIQREINSQIIEATKRFPVVTLTGPRQSGKTTLVRNLFPHAAYVSLEPTDQRSMALQDPRGFLDRFRGQLLIIDEVQRAPDLLSFIQTRVDEDGASGQFILTGSQNFLLLEAVSQSLAGRTALMHLLPLSLSELWGRSSAAAEALGTFQTAVSPLKGTTLNDVLFAGFYPRLHDKGLPPTQWLGDYYETYVERDVRQMINVQDLETFRRFVRLCAGRNGQLLNYSSLGADAGLTHATARRWVSILKASFIITLLEPFHQNLGKRIVKSPKLYFLDTGLLCFLLGIRSPDDLAWHPARGPIFESFVLSELLKSAYHRAERPALFFWRDHTGHEVDILIERGRSVLPLEVKSGQTVAPDFFTGLDRWQKTAHRLNEPAALVYGGSEAHRHNNVAVHPWTVFAGK